jgi:hypothetical protein
LEEAKKKMKDAGDKIGLNIGDIETASENAKTDFELMAAAIMAFDADGEDGNGGPAGEFQTLANKLLAVKTEASGIRDILVGTDGNEGLIDKVAAMAYPAYCASLQYSNLASAIKAAADNMGTFITNWSTVLKDKI